MFRTIELPDDRFVVERLVPITVKSRALKRRVDMTLWSPDCARGKSNLPIVILLHGVYGSHWAWSLKGGAHRTAARMIESGELPPSILAMPSDGLFGDGSGYLPSAFGNAEEWIVREVPAAVEAAFDEAGPASPIYIAGLSMGGFGALRLGAKYPEVFRAVSAHSSATHFDQLQNAVEESLESMEVAREDKCVFTTLVANRDRLPPFRFDCGSGDFLFPANEDLHKKLMAEGIHHEFGEFPGAHDWAYWETHLADSFRFFAARM
jgi:putative tributyrin esterase